MQEQDDPKVTIFYEGIYADRLVWKTDRFAEFANQSDLRTYIYIMKGDDMDEPQISALGEVFTWSTILSAANPFSNPSGLGKPFEIFHSETEEGILEADIVINDQILAERAKKQNNGQLQPYTYAQLLNREVRKGLRSVLLAEKTHLFKYTGGLMALHLGTIPFMAGATRLQTELFRHFLDPGIIEMWRISEVMLPLVCGGGVIYRYRQFYKSIKEDPGQYLPYLASFGDLNPTKYPADILKGVFYLQSKGKTLVEV